DVVGLGDVGELGEASPGVGGVPQAIDAAGGVATGQPYVTFDAGDRLEVTAHSGQSGRGRLGERRATVGADIELAGREAVELHRVDPVRTDDRAGGDARRGGPGVAEADRVVDAGALRAPQE